MNKSKFHETGCKKILHKVKKHWVTISLSLLMMLGSGAITAHAISADSTNNNQTITSCQVKSQLQYSNHDITNKAKNLHQGILNNAVNQNNSKNISQNTNIKGNAENDLKGQSDKESNQNDKNKYQVTKSVNLKDSDSSDENTYDGPHYISNSNGNIEFTSGTLTWNGNDTSSDSFLQHPYYYFLRE